MVEFYLRSARSIARARSSLVGPYLDGFAAALRELGYCRLVGQWCITYAVHLGLWAAAEASPSARWTREPCGRSWRICHGVGAPGTAPVATASPGRAPGSSCATCAFAGS